MIHEACSGGTADDTESSGEEVEPRSDLASAMGERGLHLAALDAVVSEWGGPLRCGLVSRDGVPMLHVVSTVDESRWMDVDCEPVGGVWWFLRAGCGEGIVPVAEVADAPAVLVRVVKRHAGGAGGSGVGR
ncbi:hypothetical protein ACQEU6_45150 [Spirillospora sp. CA-108201]